MQNQNGCIILLGKWLASAVAIYAAAWLIPGIWVNNFMAAVWVALVLGIFNVLLKPLLTLISLPLIVITFGVFLVVINAVGLLVASDFVDGFFIRGFWPAFWGSLVISFVSYVLNLPAQPRQND